MVAVSPPCTGGGGHSGPGVGGRALQAAVAPWMGVHRARTGLHQEPPARLPSSDGMALLLLHPPRRGTERAPHSPQVAPGERDTWGFGLWWPDSHVPILQPKGDPGPPGRTASVDGGQPGPTGCRQSP